MKTVFFITMMALSSFILKAQHVEPGIKGGLNISTVRVNSSGTNYDPRVSGHVGGLLHVHLTEQFAIQPEVVFSGQGYKSGNTTFRLNYVNVPVLLQYMFKSGFRLETGPQVGFLVSGKTKNGSVVTDIKSEYKNVDLAWAFGAGYLTKSGFGLDARFNLGIAKVNENPQANKVTNGVFQVGVFYQFKALHHN